MSDHPFAIIAAMPGHKPKAIGRSNSRIDADGTIHFLQRKVPNGSFYVIFDPEETYCLSDAAKADGNRQAIAP